LLAAAAGAAAIVGPLASGSPSPPASSSSSRGGPLGPEGVPVPAGGDLAAASGPGTPAGPVDGISCLGGEQLAFHIHAHLAVFADGRPMRVPGGIGIRDPQVENTPAGPFVGGGSCFYWLHTHAADGIVHIESPVARTYTLGEFFDVWGQPLGRGRVGPARGPVTVFEDGRPYRADPRTLPLTAHRQIVLEVGTPVLAPEPIRFPAGL
jgi:hypothetical protein